MIAGYNENININPTIILITRRGPLGGMILNFMLT
jgi:hypothetical protein